MQEEVKNLLDELKGTTGVIGCGLVTKDGRPVEMRLPENMNLETVAIMCATVFGGSMTLSTEAGRATPQSIRIKSEGYKTSIYQCGRRSLAIVMMEEKSDMERVRDLVQRLGTEFGSI